jgi:hypothetical protein
MSINVRQETVRQYIVRRMPDVPLQTICEELGIPMMTDSYMQNEETILEVDKESGLPVRVLNDALWRLPTETTRRYYTGEKDEAYFARKDAEDTEAESTKTEE